LKHIERIDVAGYRPVDELSGVHTTVSGLTIVDPRLWTRDFFSELSLGKICILA